jgi:hypothetical protein
MFRLTNVSSSYVSRAVNGEGDAVRHLLAPAVGVKLWVIPSFLARINVDPSALVIGVNLRPDMVLGVPYPSHATADGSAKHAKAVRPLSHSSSARLKQSPHITVSWESLVGTA